MTVIPLLLAGPYKSVVATRDDFRRDGEAILIEELDRAQFEAAGPPETIGSNVSYDFRVGAEYRDHRETGRIKLPEDGVITIAAKNAVVIETRERVHFPVSRFGVIVPKVGLLQQGLSNTTSKIDPGYNGRLLITVFNLGKKTIELRFNQPFCTLYVLEVGPGARLYQKPDKRIDDDTSRRWWVRKLDWLEGRILVLQAILGIALLLVQISLITCTSTRLQRATSPAAVSPRAHP